MRRPPSTLLGSAHSLALPLAFALAALSSAGCATYRQDLDRAREHYEANEFEKALALFRVLEPDMDSLSESEKARYAYYRGMTDFRLAGLSAERASAVDAKKGYRDNARHWLAIAAAIDKKSPGALGSDEKQRLVETLGELNRDVYGGADTLTEPEGSEKGSKGEGKGSSGDDKGSKSEGKGSSGDDKGEGKPVDKGGESDKK